MTEAPGPFSRDGRHICEDGKTILSWYFDARAGDEAERDELVGLLNKGTHFDGMMSALNWAAVMLEKPRYMRAGPGPCSRAVRAAIAKAQSVVA